MARGGGLTNGQEPGMFRELGSRTHSKGHAVGLAGLPATSAPTMNLTTNSSHALESLFLASSPGERMCVLYRPGRKERGSRHLDTLVAVGTVPSQEAHDRDFLPKEDEGEKRKVSV